MTAKAEFKNMEATIAALVKDCLHGVHDIDTTVYSLTRIIVNQATKTNNERRRVLVDRGAAYLKENQDDFDRDTRIFSLHTLQDVVLHEMWRATAKIPVDTPEDYPALLFLQKIWTTPKVYITWLYVNDKGMPCDKRHQIWDVEDRVSGESILESTMYHVVKSYYSEWDIEQGKSAEQFQEWLNLSKFLACLFSQGIVNLPGAGLCEAKFLGNEPPYNYKHEHSEPWVITAAQWPIYAADAMWEGANKRCFGNLKWWASWKRRFLMVASGHGEFKRDTRQIALEAYDAMVAAEAKDYRTLNVGEKLNWERYRIELDENEDEEEGNEDDENKEEK
ncbi:hypothetical protein VHEMI03056 [[Torrubiella] hemipterigena]|uniref:Uncharacterized protein n=1 Tax=[Torrubiella] hemipterigena TaxID=1531966 RepID=A0A0A1T9R1_9HYPO|nr:hypothetical protein VHEMI03056 [[Torrubiella] hemipterigena]